MARSTSSPAWWARLEPVPAEVFRGRGDPEDPRLGEVTRRWNGQPCSFQSGQPVLLGFPYDEGVRRNQGRVGAALAPEAIRGPLYLLTPWDPVARVDLAALNVLDLGNVSAGLGLEAAQDLLGEITAALLHARAIPLILGGGHETAFGHFLGYAKAGLACGIINVDAHLDVRPYPSGGHSGSPFRQALEHPAGVLKRYGIIGAQRQRVARGHAEFVEKEHPGVIHWLKGSWPPEHAVTILAQEIDLSKKEGRAVLLSIDADAFRQGDVPGVSAPGPIGLPGEVWPELAFLAGRSPEVRSLDLVEINPAFDRDGQTARWAALGLRQFLVGLALRPNRQEPG